MRRLTFFVLLLFVSAAIVSAASEEPPHIVERRRMYAAFEQTPGPPRPQKCVASVPSNATFRVEGRHVVDGAGRTVVLHGVVRPSLEYTPRGIMLSAHDYATMARTWRSQIVRIDIRQQYALDDSPSFDPTYLNCTLDTQVAWAHGNNMTVILNLWGTDGGLRVEPPGTKQHRLADVRSVRLWRMLANKYRDYGNVWFELFNEPNGVDWKEWLHGDGKLLVGYQRLYDVVRHEARATNIIVLGGINWAYDLSGVLVGPNGTVVDATRPDGLAYNVVYATHPYDYPTKAPRDWHRAFGRLSRLRPVMMTEFGQFDCGAVYATTAMRYAERLGIGWTAWAWFVNGCAFPSIIANWRGDPMPRMGQAVQKALLLANPDDGDDDGRSTSMAGRASE